MRELKLAMILIGFLGMLALTPTVARGLGDGPPAEMGCALEGPDVLEVAPDGSDAAGDGVDTAFESLQGAHDWIAAADRPETDWVVCVRGGTYLSQTTVWSQTSAAGSVRIQSHDGERAVFDGRGVRDFFLLTSRSGECTNVTIKDLTIRHYADRAIGFHGRVGQRENWNGCNRVQGNQIEMLGTAHNDEQNCPGCRGRAAVNLVNSRQNFIVDNVITDVANTGRPAAYARAVRLVFGASDNTVARNLIQRVSGDPIRLRADANDNKFYRNRITDSGLNAFFSAWTKPSEVVSSGNVLRHNVALFPFSRDPDTQIELVECLRDGCASENVFGATEQGRSKFIGVPLQNERVTGLGVGDTDGDGDSEIVTVLDQDGVHSLLMTSGGEARSLSRTVLSEDRLSLDPFTIGDLDGDGIDEYIGQMSFGPGIADYLVSARIEPSRMRGRLLRPAPLETEIIALAAGDLDGSDGDELVVAVDGATGGSVLYGIGNVEVDGSESTEDGLMSGWTELFSTTDSVTALTIGDLAPDGSGVLVVATEGPEGAKLCRWDGGGELNPDLCFFSSPGVRVSALASGNLGQNATPRLLTVVERDEDGLDQLFTGDLFGAARAELTDSDTSDITFIEIGPVGLDGEPALVSAFDGDDESRIVVGSGDGAQRIDDLGVVKGWPVDPVVPTIPSTTVPVTAVPETILPVTTVPEPTVPETSVPMESSVPDTTVPTLPPRPVDTSVPGTTVPQTSVPEPTLPGPGGPSMPGSETDTALESGGAGIDPLGVADPSAFGTAEVERILRSGPPVAATSP